MSNQTKPLFANVKITIELADRAVPAVKAVCDKFENLSAETWRRELDKCSMVLRHRGVYAFARGLKGCSDRGTIEYLKSFTEEMNKIRSELMATDGIYHAHAETDFDTY